MRPPPPTRSNGHVRAKYLNGDEAAYQNAVRATGGSA